MATCFSWGVKDPRRNRKKKTQAGHVTGIFYGCFLKAQKELYQQHCKVIFEAHIYVEGEPLRAKKNETCKPLLKRR